MDTIAVTINIPASMSVRVTMASTIKEMITEYEKIVGKPTSGPWHEWRQGLENLRNALIRGR